MSLFYYTIQITYFQVSVFLNDETKFLTLIFLLVMKKKINLFSFNFQSIYFRNLFIHNIEIILEKMSQ